MKVAWIRGGGKLQPEWGSGEVFIIASAGLAHKDAFGKTEWEKAPL